MTFIIFSDIFCDICNSDCKSDERGHIMLGSIDSEDMAVSIAKRYGWIKRNGQHICEECQEKKIADGK